MIQEDKEAQKQIISRLNDLDNVQEQIDFLHQCLSENPSASSDLFAFIHQELARLFSRQNLSQGDPYETAGDYWEKFWLECDGTSFEERVFQRKILKRALRNYRKARALYERKEFETKATIAKQKEHHILAQLRKTHPVARFSSLGATLAAFVFALVFFSSTITGFTIANLDNSETLFSGAFLFLAALFGLFVTVRYWFGE